MRPHLVERRGRKILRQNYTQVRFVSFCPLEALRHGWVDFSFARGARIHLHCLRFPVSVYRNGAQERYLCIDNPDAGWLVGDMGQIQSSCLEIQDWQDGTNPDYFVRQNFYQVPYTDVSFYIGQQRIIESLLENLEKMSIDLLSELEVVPLRLLKKRVIFKELSPKMRIEASRMGRVLVREVESVGVETEEVSEFAAPLNYEKVGSVQRPKRLPSD